jgi:hypothetical protein
VPSATDPGRDRGSSFIEVVVTLTLTGMIVAAILTAVQASVKSSSTNYEAAQIETVLLNASDYVHRAEATCAYDAVAAKAAPSDWSIAVTVENLVDEPTGDAGADWVPCTGDVAAFDVQRVTISATDPTTGITRSMTVVRSHVD